MKITALKKQKRNPDRVSVFLDDSFAFGLEAITAAYLRVGQTLSEADIEKLQQDDTVEQAKQAAFRYLSYRPRSVDEVRRRLLKQEYPEAMVEDVLQRLLTLKLLDDAAFAKYWVEQRENFKPRSRMALQQELLQKGIARDVIETALADLDETAAARRAAEKKVSRWSHLPEDEFRKKMGGYLQRRGFHFGIIRTINDDMWAQIAHTEQTDNP